MFFGFISGWRFRLDRGREFMNSISSNFGWSTLSVQMLHFKHIVNYGKNYYSIPKYFGLNCNDTNNVMYSH